MARPQPPRGRAARGRLAGALTRVGAAELAARTTHDVEVFAFDAHDDYVFSLAWSHVGPRLVSASGDATVKVWDARPRREREADQRARRARLEAFAPLTDDELRARWHAADTAGRGDILRVLLARP